MKKVMIVFMICMLNLALIGCSSTNEKQTADQPSEEEKQSQEPNFTDTNTNIDTSMNTNTNSNSYLSLTNLDIQNVRSGSVNFLDTNHQTDLDQEAIDLLKQDLKTARPLQDPPMIFGVPYPYITIELNNFTLTWLSPDIVQFKSSDDNSSGWWIQVSNSQWWSWVQANHHEEFKRTGLFSEKAKFIVLSNFSSKVSINDQNRLDQFWRFFSKSMNQAHVLTTPKVHVDGTQSLTFIDHDLNPIIKVWSDDTFEYEGKTYLQENIYQEIESWLTAG